MTIETNKEMEELDTGGNSWLLAYADNSAFYIPDALHVERNDELGLVEDDAKASKDAKEDGVPLIVGMTGVPDDAYVDTVENRRVLTEMLKKYPEYANITRDK